MAVEIRTCEPGELASALAPIWHYFGRAANEEDAERLGRVLPHERTHVAVDDGAVVGGAGAYLFDLTVPGGQLPTAGIVAVGVLPTHRRRGILRGLMRQQLDEAHGRGEPLALLYASEGAIYRHYGYGLASLAGDISIERAHAKLYDVGDPLGTARLLSKDEALEVFPEIYDRARAQTPGMFTRSREWWEIRKFWSPPWAKGDLVCALIEIDGEPQAYAMYRLEFGAEHMVFKTTLQLTEAIGATPAGTREIWRFLFDTDLVGTISGSYLPPDHPLFLLLTEPRRLNFHAIDALWLRLVDVGAALSGRSYAADGRVVLEVRDEFCPWNEGRWALESGTAEKTEDGAGLSLGVDALASVYLGGFTLAELASAGRVEELRAGALAEADAVFRTGTHPWCPEIF